MKYKHVTVNHILNEKRACTDNLQDIFVGFVLHFYLSYVDARNICGKSKIFHTVKCFKLRCHQL